MESIKTAFFCWNDQTLPTSSYLLNNEPHVFWQEWRNISESTPIEAQKQRRRFTLNALYGREENKVKIDAFGHVKCASHYYSMTRILVWARWNSSSQQFSDYFLLSPSQQSHTPLIRSFATTLWHRLCPPEYNIHGVSYILRCVSRDPYYAIRV